MPRLVRHSALGPIKIDPSTLPLGPDGKPRTISVCACGLSANFPFCDGTHKACAAEKPDHIYRYDPVTKRVVEERPETA